jgi:hypothetical protein
VSDPASLHTPFFYELSEQAEFASIMDSDGPTQLCDRQ